MTIRDRSRTYSALPLFEPRFNFQAPHRLIDKLEVNFDLAAVSVTSPRGELYEMMRRIPKNHSLFRGVQLKSSYCIGIKKYAAGPLTVQDSQWLYSGKIMLVDGVLRAMLKLNPTRHIANNPPNRIIRTRSETLTQYMPVAVRLGSQSLDGNDNFIPANRLSDIRGETLRFLRSYLQTVVEELSNSLRGVLGDDGITYHYRPYKWTIASIELYWEFSAERAVSTVRSFGDFVYRNFHTYSRRFPLDRVDGKNSVVYFIFQTTKSNRSLAVYAKTPERIRIEYRYHSNPRSLYAKETRGWNNNTLDGFIEFISFLTFKAAAELEVFNEASVGYEVSDTLQSCATADHLSEWFKLVRGYDLNSVVRPILDDLFSCGQVSEVLGCHERSSFLKRAERKKLLTRLRKHRGRAIYFCNGPIAHLVRRSNQQAYPISLSNDNQLNANDILHTM